MHYKDVWTYPAFNIADSAICVGAALLVIDAIFDRKHPDKDKDKEQNGEDGKDQADGGDAKEAGNGEGK